MKAIRRRDRVWVCIPNYHGLTKTPAKISQLSLFHLLGMQNRCPGFSEPTNTIVSVARQYCVNQALNDQDASHVVFIDADMTFGPEQYLALETEFINNDLDFLSAMAFSNSIPTKPCVFGRNPEFEEWGEKPWWHVITDYPRDQRFEVYASGMGMTLISKRMLEAMRGETEGYQHFVYPHAMAPNEDIAFCLNAKKCGYKLYVDSRVCIGHISKEEPIITEDTYIGQGTALLDTLDVTRYQFKPGSTDIEPVPTGTPIMQIIKRGE